VEKYFRAEEATNDNITTAQALCMPDNYGYKHTFRIINIIRIAFYTATVVTRTQCCVTRTSPVLYRSVKNAVATRNKALIPILYILRGTHFFSMRKETYVLSLQYSLTIKVKLVIYFVLTLRLLMSYIYGAPILGVSRSHTTTQYSR